MFTNVYVCQTKNNSDNTRKAQICDKYLISI